MYKFSFEEKEVEMEERNENRRPDYMYAEKEGLYCDLCGQLIEEVDRLPIVSRYVGYSYHRPLHSIEGMSERHDEYVNDMSPAIVIPVIELRSINRSQKLDLCPDCESKITEGVMKNAKHIIQNLVSVSRHEILYNAKEREAMDHRNRDLEAERDILREALHRDDC